MILVTETHIEEARKLLALHKDFFSYSVHISELNAPQQRVSVFIWLTTGSRVAGESSHISGHGPTAAKALTELQQVIADIRANTWTHEDVGRTLGIAA